MTIKAFVLDALGKFWNKLKGSYITPMQNNIETIESNLFTNVGTAVTDFNSITTPGTYYVADMTQVSNAPSSVTFTNAHSGQLQVIPRGTSSRVFQILYVYMGSSQPLEFIRCMTGENTWGSWFEYPSQSTMDERFKINSSSLSSAMATCEATSIPDRLVTHNHFIKDNISDYDIIQLIYEKNGLLVMGRARSDSKYHSLIHCPTLIYGIPITANTDLNTCTTIGTYYCEQTTTAASLTNCPTAVAFTMQVSYGTGSGYLAQSIHEYNSARTYFRSCSNAAGTGSWSAWYTPAQSITGGASSIATSNLTASRALVSDGSGKVGVSAVTSTELGYLNGVTSAIQTQINGKAPTSHASTATTYGLGTASNYGHVKVSDTYASKTTNAAAANGIVASQNALYNAYNAYRQQANSALSVTNLPFFGQITGGGKTLNLWFPWYLKLPNTITVSAITLTARHANGGYIGGSASYNPKGESGTTVTASRTSNSAMLILTIQRSTSASAYEAPNNSPVNGTATMTLAISGSY